MSRPVRFSMRARRDIIEHFDYLASRNPTVAKNLLIDLNRRCALLGTSPLASRPRDEMGAGVRSVVLSPYIVFLRVLPDHVLILRVIHGARDISNLRGAL